MTEDELAAKVCQFYYFEQMTMSEIGDRVGLSRHKVGRILSGAIASGLVKIEIRHPLSRSSSLENELVSRFNLRSALVPNFSEALPAEELKQRVGAAAARFVSSTLSDGDIVGVGWGTTTFEVANQINGTSAKQIKVVQITGGNGALGARFSCQDVTRTFATKLGVEPILLHAPAIVGNSSTRDLLLQEPMIRDVADLFSKISISVVGIGTLEPMASALAESGLIPAKNLKEIIRQGAIGDIYSYFIDSDGNVVDTDLNDRMIAIGLDDIKRIPRSVAVATGTSKAGAVRAAAVAGLANVLVVDEALAEAILRRD